MLSEADILAAAPEQSPPAPWRSNVELAAWTFRSTPGSAAAVPAPLTPGLGLGVAAFINYLDGAVGPYREILASPRCVTGAGVRGLCGHVPFIAVDSVPSIHGGRNNWALPKEYAQFTGSPTRDGALSGSAEEWSLTAQVTSFGPWVPFRGGGRCAQAWADGSARSFLSSFSGRFRLARLEVTVDGASLSDLLPAGAHLGVLIRGSVVVGAPERI